MTLLTRKQLAEQRKAKEGVLNGTLYDVLKDAAIIYIPAAGALYASLAVIWHFGFSTEVVGTAAALSAFLGIVLKINKVKYDKSDADVDGAIALDKTANPQEYAVQMTIPADQVQDKNKIVLKVQDPVT